MERWELGTHVWERAILRIVDALQRTKETVATIDIYIALEKGTFKALTEHDLRKPPEWGGKPAYQYLVLAHLSRLTKGKTPDLKRVSRGVYCITDKGKQRIKCNSCSERSESVR
jgi:hypothetical protein